MKLACCPDSFAKLKQRCDELVTDHDVDGFVDLLHEIKGHKISMTTSLAFSYSSANDQRRATETVESVYRANVSYVTQRLMEARATIMGRDPAPYQEGAKWEAEMFFNLKETKEQFQT